MSVVRRVQGMVEREEGVEPLLKERQCRRRVATRAHRIPTIEPGVLPQLALRGLFKVEAIRVRDDIPSEALVETLGHVLQRKVLLKRLKRVNLVRGREVEGPPANVGPDIDQDLPWRQMMDE